ncbi:hypothetical protein [Ascidiimonas sp. W6]|uniref:hypothetical protein n=1 Tax=Ascidiimonas meishanensis TaxID=3128903 RepID=UPI0030ED73AB
MKNKHITLGLVFGAGIGLCIGVLINSIAIGLLLVAGVGLVLVAVLGNGVKKRE